MDYLFGQYMRTGRARQFRYNADLFSAVRRIYPAGDARP